MDNKIDALTYWLAIANHNSDMAIRAVMETDIFLLCKQYSMWNTSKSSFEASACVHEGWGLVGAQACA